LACFVELDFVAIFASITKQAALLTTKKVVQSSG